MGRRLAVDGLGDEEGGPVLHVDQAALGVLDPRLAADAREQGVVEALGARDVVAADHHVAEHACVLPGSGGRSPVAPAGVKRRG